MVLAPIVALGAALRWSRWPRFALGIGTVAFFVVLTGAEPSVMRAGVMAGLALIGVVLVHQEESRTPALAEQTQSTVDMDELGVAAPEAEA
jgi:competence protein ComEC